jgi:hypothetical protein
MQTLTITIESALGSRMKFQVEHEIHFDLRSEEFDGLRGRISDPPAAGVTGGLPTGGGSTTTDGR